MDEKQWEITPEQVERITYLYGKKDTYTNLIDLIIDSHHSEVANCHCCLLRTYCDMLERKHDTVYNCEEVEKRFILGEDTKDFEEE